MIQFIDSRPMITNVAAIQVEGLWFREADEQGLLEPALASLLIRCIRRALPDGWANRKKFPAVN